MAIPIKDQNVSVRITKNIFQLIGNYNPNRTPVGNFRSCSLINVESNSC